MSPNALKTAYVVFLAILLAGATIWLAAKVAGDVMPAWAAVLGPVLLALTIWAHWRNRRS